MICVSDYTPRLLNRNCSPDTDRDIRETVRAIISDVRRCGDTALLKYSRRFDKVRDLCIEVPRQVIDASASEIDPELLETMRLAAGRIERYHRSQLREGFEIRDPDGTVMGQKVLPIEKVGIYVPGGRAAYPSTVLMTAIPARIAGCGTIVMVTPPDSNGRISPAVLAASKIAGVDRVFAIGGAQAIAALAYGTQTVPRVDKIVGPGNAYVAEAKRQIFGAVSIDMIAGPSEILIIADKSACPAFLATDMLAQAEHDPMAKAVLLTDSRELGLNVLDEIQKRLPQLTRGEIAGQSISDNGRILIVDSISQAIGISNEWAPEHLELCLDDPMPLLGSIRNAGSVFLGHYCPEAMGDYLTGPNHTLPTSGTARFSSALGVDDFTKRVQYSSLPREVACALADDVNRFALAEGLGAHASSALIRKQAKEGQL